MKTYTIKDLEKQFPTDDACLDFLFKSRYPNGVFCEKCGKITKHYKRTGIKFYSCEFCGMGVAPTSGTIFHKSNTPLRSWFHAIFLMASTKTGISAKQLQRELGVTYKTAWRMFNEVRKLMAEDVNPLIGQVEVDETYIGGRHEGKRGRGASGKSKVIGAVERKGKVIASVVPDVKRHTLVPFVNEVVDRKAILFTDEFPTYDHMARIGYTHLRIRHHAKEYVRGKIHTNSIEGFWSLVKRGIDGVNHSVSPLYLQSYLDSYAFRYNHRRDETPMFESLLNRVALLAEQPF